MISVIKYTIFEFPISTQLSQIYRSSLPDSLWGHSQMKHIYNYVLYNYIYLNRCKF